MKKFVFCLVIMFVPSILFAGTWCQWDESAGINCKSTTKTSIVIDDHRVTVSAENLNPRGWFERTITQPTIGPDQIRDAEVWDKVDNQISLTWSVRDLTATELDNRAASPMSVNDYYVWKAFMQAGIFTQAQLVAYFQANQPEMIEAYQARDRLLNPE